MEKTTCQSNPGSVRILEPTLNFRWVHAFRYTGAPVASIPGGENCGPIPCVLQQQWIQPSTMSTEWLDVPTVVEGANRTDDQIVRDRTSKTFMDDALEHELRFPSFTESLKRLNIEDYGERILHSNSRGELMHLVDYVRIANSYEGDMAWFRPLFVRCVEFAEKNWRRPESCFQHMPQLLAGALGLIQDGGGSDTLKTS